MLLILSRIFGDRTVGFRRSKRESSSTRRELRVGMRIQSFCQTPRGRGFSPTRFNSYLRVVQMDGAFGAETAVHFSPKDLGLNVGFLGLFSDSLELNFWD